MHGLQNSRRGAVDGNIMLGFSIGVAFSACVLIFFFANGYTKTPPVRVEATVQTPDSSFLPTPVLPRIPTRAFSAPLLRDQDVNAPYLRLIPLRVLNVDKSSGLVNVEASNGNTFFMLGIRGLSDMERGAYFKIVESIDKDTGVLSRKALRILESDIDFITGLFAEGTDERKEADELLNIGP